jgi:paraquat-inducible protein A
MKIENEDELDNLIICQQCFTLHEEVPIQDGSKACCTECGGILYRYDSKLVNHGLSMSITGLIFFILANAFPLIQIDILGSEQFITMPKTIFSLFESGFYLVGFLCLFLILVFPLMILMINILLFTLLKLERGAEMTKELLILLSYITPWSMADIFFISILVALVKLIAFGQINIGIAFWALMIFILIDVYITKRISLFELWMQRKRIFFKNGNR